MKKSKFLYFLAWLFIFLGLIMIIWYLVILRIEGWNFWHEGDLSIETAGQFGDYIGGFIGTIFSIAGFIFLYLTLKEQREAFRSERFETRFIEMVKFHRENVDKMTIEIESHDQNERVVYNGQQCFKIMFQQLTEIRNDLRPFFKKRDENQIYLREYRELLNSEVEIKKRGISLKEIAKIDIAYCIVFFGSDYNGKHILSQNFSKKYAPSFTESILNYIALKPIRSSVYYDKWNRLQGLCSFEKRIEKANRIYSLRNRTSKSEDASLIDEDLKYFYRNDYIKYYGGHQIRLSHYFRHLYQTVNSVDEQSFLTYKDKYDYIKLLRAQMSLFEQIILFFNSVSSLGDIWELRSLKNKPYESLQKGKKSNVNTHLITKYNLIKNLSDGQLLRMEFAILYPDISYEFSEKTEKRKKLELLYF